MRVLRLLLIVGSLLGCSDPGTSGRAEAATVEPAAVEPEPEVAPRPARPRVAPVRNPRVEAGAGDRVTIPSGTLRVGSEGSFG